METKKIYEQPQTEVVKMDVVLLQSGSPEPATGGGSEGAPEFQLED